MGTAQGYRSSTALLAGQLGVVSWTSSPVDRRRLRAHAGLMAEINEAALIADVERRLISKYSQFPPEEVSTIVQSAVARFAHSPIREFVPLLVERHATARLAELRSLALSK